MTIIDITTRPKSDTALEDVLAIATGTPDVGSTLPTTCHLVWDLPNMMATLGKIVGSSAAKKTRYEYASLAKYVVETAGEELTPAGTVFMNVPKEQASGLQRLAVMFRSCGFGVYARPKIADSDIDDNLVAHVEANASDTAHLLIATHDKALIERTMAVLDASCRITVLGFEEQSSYAVSSDRMEFVDLEDVDGMFAKPLARALFTRLPDEGAYLRPLGSLKDAKRAA